MAQTEEIILNTTVNTGNSEASVKSVKQELRQLTNELAKLEPGSAKFVELSQRAGKLKDQINDANAAVKAFNPEAKFQSFATVLGGVVNGFTAIQGAMTIFGDKNKDIEQVIAKTQGAIALATGINGLMGMKDGFINLGSQLIKMIPALKSFGAAAVGALTGGIATAIILIISYWDDLKAMVTGTVEAVKLGEKEIAEARDKGHEAFKKAAQERADIAKREAQTKKEGRALDLELAAIDRKLKLEQAVADGKLAEQRALIEAEYRKAVSDINKKYDKEEADRLKAKQEKEDKALLDKIQKRFDQEDKADEERLKNLIEGREKAFKQEVNQIEEQDRLRRLILAKKLTADEITKKEYDARLVESENQKNAEIVAAGEKHYQDVTAQQKALKEAEVTAALVTTESKQALRIQDLQNQKAVADATMQGLTDLANAMGANAETMKAIAIAQTTIDTYYAASLAFKQANANPTTIAFPAYPYIVAGAAIAAGLARVAAIVRTPAKGSGGGGAPSGGGGGTAPSAPMIAPASNMTRLTNGNEPVITRSLDVKENRVYVLEKDITSTQGRVDNIRNQATVQ